MLQTQVQLQNFFVKDKRTSYNWSHFSFIKAGDP